MARKVMRKNKKVLQKEESSSIESTESTSKMLTNSESNSQENENQESEHRSIEDSKTREDSKIEDGSKNEENGSESSESVYDKENVKKAKKIIDEISVSSSEEDEKEEIVGEDGSSSEETQSGSKDDEEDDELSRRIFIKCLDFDITEESLREEVEKIGPTGDINVPLTHDSRRNKGFAYVDFNNKSDALKFLKLNDQEFMGRKVIVDKAKPKSNYLLYTVFVKNLNFSTKKSELNEYFSKFGKVHNVSLPIDSENEGRNKGFCFIEYLDKEIAKKVVDGTHIINGRTLYLNMGKKNERRNEKRSNDRLYGRKGGDNNYNSSRNYRDNNKRNDRRGGNDSRNDRFYNRNE